MSNWKKDLKDFFDGRRTTPEPPVKITHIIEDDRFPMPVHLFTTHPTKIEFKNGILYITDNGLSLTEILRDCVSETWGAKSFSEAQQLFDKFLESRKIPKNIP